MKKTYSLPALFVFLASLALLACLSCDQLFGGASPSPTPSSALAWTEVGSATGPAFENGWSNYGGVYQTCAYALDVQGQLHIVGLLSDTTPLASGQIVFTLPAGYRPTSYQRSPISFMPASFAGPATGILSVETNGNVFVYPPDGGHMDLADLGQVIVRLR